MSLSFLGNSTSFITVPNNSALDFNTGDFTVEWYQYETDTNSFPRIFNYGTSYDNSQIDVAVSIEGGSFYLWTNNTPNFIGGLSSTDYKNIWVHFAICRNSGTIVVYKNGNPFGNTITYGDSISSSNDLTIGNETADKTVGASFGGLIYGFCWTVGVSLYNAPFTPSIDLPQVTVNTIVMVSGTSPYYYGTLGDTVVNTNVGFDERVPTSLPPTPPTPSGPPVYNVVSSPPTLTVLNNGTLTAIKAMPFKDSTSDGTASFTMSRRSFVKGYYKDLSGKKNTNIPTPTGYNINQTTSIVDDRYIGDQYIFFRVDIYPPDWLTQTTVFSGYFVVDTTIDVSVPFSGGLSKLIVGFHEIDNDGENYITADYFFPSFYNFDFNAYAVFFDIANIPVLLNFNNFLISGSENFTAIAVSNLILGEIGYSINAYLTFDSNELDQTSFPYPIPESNPYPSNANQNYIPPNLQKKWIGGNRDSSEIARRRRVNAVGAGSFNTANQPFSFKTNRDVNVTFDALTRVRAGGSNVPKKVTQKYMNK